MLECLHPLVIGERKKSGCESFYIFNLRKEHIDLHYFFRTLDHFQFLSDMILKFPITLHHCEHHISNKSEIESFFLLFSYQVIKWSLKYTRTGLVNTICKTLNWWEKLFLGNNFLQEFRFWTIKNELQISMRK